MIDRIGRFGLASQLTIVTLARLLVVIGLVAAESVQQLVQLRRLLCLFVLPSSQFGFLGDQGQFLLLNASSGGLDTFLPIPLALLQRLEFAQRPPQEITSRRRPFQARRRCLAGWMVRVTHKVIVRSSRGLDSLVAG